MSAPEGDSKFSKLTQTFKDSRENKLGHPAIATKEKSTTFIQQLYFMTKTL